MKKVYHAPEQLPEKFDVPCVFLAGSIEQDTAEKWQQYVQETLAESECILLNPRRPKWYKHWKQDADNPEFRRQVNWELEGLKRSDYIFCYFSPPTKSPISLLELGLFAQSGKLIVCCPDGFWRKGNVDLVCENFSIPNFGNIDQAISCLEQLANI